MAYYTKEKIKHIERKWQKYWRDHNIYKVTEDTEKPKYYVLDMFPYPSGAGLHVGHPLGYIASDIVARFKRHKGFNVLHPIGFDAFGLPAEQYALEHGIHPSISTEKNIVNFRKQLTSIGLSYDWSREVQTCHPHYYKWTQWIFLQMFDSWYNKRKKKAERISVLIQFFEKEGNIHHPFPNSAYLLPISNERTFSAKQWKKYNLSEQRNILMEYRLAYLAYTQVNWCEALGTVLANDEVINGVSYRGGHPVTKKKMQQWNLRITAYADRLLEGLKVVTYSESLKEMQRNWIGKSIGAHIYFKIEDKANAIPITVFTTRPDTIFGVDFIVLAPEHSHIERLTQKNHVTAVKEYLQYTKSRSDVERIADTTNVTGCFTGSYTLHPITHKKIPIWISEYVLVDYGTGAIMGVPCADERDHRFAKHFNITITNIIGDYYDGKKANPAHETPLYHSDFLNNSKGQEAISLAIETLEKNQIGKQFVNYKMHDAGWSRQRYWGEPFPVVYKNDNVYAISEADLPLELPKTEKIKPSESGEGPLANLHEWIHVDEYTRRDANTMPTHAGASWYFLRFTDPHNDSHFADIKKLNYWNQVDVYIGGAEHAVAHLLYARLWNKVLYDLGYVSFDEPFKKLINQGKIMGDSRFIYRIKNTNQFVSAGLKNQYATDKLRIDISLVDGLKLRIEDLKRWRHDFNNAIFILENGEYICGQAIEKMSKSYFNTVSPDYIINTYGADTLRMYEMFLGPLEQSKPWNTHGINGVIKFLKKFWTLFHNKQGQWIVNEEEATKKELKVLHKTIHKVTIDIERFSFNTAVSELMICVNNLTKIQCSKKAILEPLTIIMAPFAPHIAEELWEKLGHTNSIVIAPFPIYQKQYLIDESVRYPVSINGKVRATIICNTNTSVKEMESMALALEDIKKRMNNQIAKKIIVIPNKIINIVI